jgi:hypothetical protein
MPTWVLHRDCATKGKDPQGWWNPLPSGGPNLTCTGCKGQFSAPIKATNFPPKFNPNENDPPSSPSSPDSKSGVQPSQLVVDVKDLIAQSPRAGMSGGATVKAQPDPGQDQKTPVVQSASPSTGAQTPVQQQAGATSNAPSVTAPVTVKWSFQDRSKIRAEILKTLTKAKVTCGKSEATADASEKRKAALAAMSAAKDEGVEAPALESAAKESSGWDSKAKAITTKLTDVKSRAESANAKWVPLAGTSPSSPNDDGKLRPLSEEVRLLNEDITALEKDIADLAQSADSVIDPLKKAVAALRLAVASATARADNVTPKTLEQARLKRDYDVCRLRKEATKLEKKQKAEALLARVKEDESKKPVEGEKEYVKLRERQVERLASLKTFLTGPNAGTFPVSLSAYEELDGKIADGAPDRFTAALKALRKTLIEADDQLKELAKGVAGKIESIVNAKGAEDTDEEKGNAARKLAKDTNPEVLRALPAQHQAMLLKELRKGNVAGLARTANKSLRDMTDEEASELSSEDQNQRKLLLERQHQQTRVYMATELDKTFLQEEKKSRAKVIGALTSNPQAKAELQKARDGWATMNDSDKEKILKKIIEAHCEGIGFDKPKKLVLNSDDHKVSGGFQHAEAQININKDGDIFNDFELTMDSIFHENSHNWQSQLIRKFRAKGISENDPLYRQALLFEANQGEREDGTDGYDNGAGYKVQPKEAHAHRAGPKFAKALMRALA